MKICLTVFAFLNLMIIGSLIDTAIPGDETKPENKVIITTPGIEARLCPQPACGPDQHITRIPAGTVLTIERTEIFAIGTFKVKWFEVVYRDLRGWVSIYDTDKTEK